MMMCLVANKLDVAFMKEHVFMMCFQMLASLQPTLTMDGFNALKGQFMLAAPSAIIGDGTDPLALRQRSYLFNHWVTIDNSNLILTDNDLVCPYFEQGVNIRDRMPDLDLPGEFEKCVQLYAGQPVYHISERSRHVLYPPYHQTALADVKNARDAGFREDKKRTSNFGVRGVVMA
jgi:hypothetical protein